MPPSPTPTLLNPQLPLSSLPNIANNHWCPHQSSTTITGVHPTPNIQSTPSNLTKSKFPQPFHNSHSSHQNHFQQFQLLQSSYQIPTPPPSTFIHNHILQHFSNFHLLTIIQQVTTRTNGPSLLIQLFHTFNHWSNLHI